MRFLKWFFSGLLKLVIFFGVNALMMIIHPIVPFVVWPVAVLYLFYLNRKTS
ncbi:hypothetical protein [Flavobacterium psychrophilum]|uniref:Uncharacterized protein n=1 Tax=Flavobacterium psychrophilum TaxID=96345 RepID=A0A7U2NHN3_FLAPS|nr:hypothetical protein [Flavobacterium psychrophilum]QRE05287.1 hypothetical protein H0H26_06795 [Flavobacterium psychrophilum]